MELPVVSNEDDIPRISSQFAILEELYAHLLGLFTRTIIFFHDHQHGGPLFLIWRTLLLTSHPAIYIKLHWNEVVNAADTTRASIRPLSARFKDMAAQARETSRMQDAETSSLKLIRGITKLETSAEQPKERCYQLPAILNRVFQGRSEMLDHLHNHLDISREQNNFVSIALYGYPGAGKTQLALQLGHSLTRLDRFHSVLWICAADQDKLDEDIFGIATQLNVLPDIINPGERGPLARTKLMEWINNLGTENLRNS